MGNFQLLPMKIWLWIGSPTNARRHKKAILGIVCPSFLFPPTHTKSWHSLVAYNYYLSGVAGSCCWVWSWAACWSGVALAPLPVGGIRRVWAAVGNTSWDGGQEVDTLAPGKMVALGLVAVVKSKISVYIIKKIWHLQLTIKNDLYNHLKHHLK